MIYIIDFLDYWILILSSLFLLDKQKLPLYLYCDFPCNLAEISSSLSFR